MFNLFYTFYNAIFFLIGEILIEEGGIDFISQLYIYYTEQQLLGVTFLL